LVGGHPATEAANFDRNEIRDAAIAKYEARCCRQLRLHNVLQILNAEYFTRVRVAQEIFLGKSVICQLGNRLFSIATLVASMELWGEDLYLDDMDLDCITYYYLMPSLDLVWHTLDSNVQLGTQAQDLSIVNSFGRKKCSDPRDHVYGLSALFEGPIAYPINYSLSVAEVFCNFTVHCLRKLENLQIFGICRGIMRNSFETHDVDSEIGLPSWCPSWAAEPPMDVRILATGRSSGERSLYLVRSSPLRITLKGYAVSKIAWYSMNTQRSRQSSAAAITATVEYLLSCPQRSLSSVNGQMPTLAQLVFSVLDRLVRWPQPHLPKTGEGSSCGLTYSMQTLPPGLDPNPGQSLGELLFPVYVSRELPDLYTLANLQLDKRIPIKNYKAIVDIFEEQFRVSIRQSGLFVTDDGMLGTDLPGVIAGDIVCVLFGGSVPLLLRPTDCEGQYLLIGPCEVRGLMEGEAMNMGLQEQKFTLV
jgi:hypothetical protein